ncbi:permease [Paenibacillus yonginensis]|uniref:Permease n=1 Tax=Paenibacillus yonginensis TaxID=1462996 RepID=A0A1B1N2S1_9BACL|nr:carbohydrate ABC transporter permease [Paenibacillus yonginensis]ANS75705.1 permease [Paenibacillus yonginensis]
MKQASHGRIVVNAVLIILSTLWIFPAVFAVFGTLKKKQEYNLSNFWDLPHGISLAENLKGIAGTFGIVKGMLNSLLYATVSAGAAVIIATLAAYAISHLKIKRPMVWFLFIYSGTIFPFQIFLIPVYKGLTATNLYDTQLGMILFYTAICVPFCMFVLRNYYLGISKEICESAKIDGCNSFQILGHIFVPMSTAPLAVVFLTQFNWVWNELMFGLTFTKSREIRPVMAAITLMDKANVPVILLACVAASIPTLLLFFLLNKHFEAGYAYQSK